MKFIFLNKILKNYLLMFITIFSVEIIFRAILGSQIIDWSLFRIFLSTNIIALLLSMIFSFFGRIASNLFTIISTLAFSIYALAQLGFENYLGVYISIGASEQAIAVTDYFIDYLMSLEAIFFLILIPNVLLILYFLIFERRVKLIIKNKKYNVLNIIGGQKLKEQEEKSIKYKEKFQMRVTGLISCGALIILSGLFYYSLGAKIMQNELQLVSNQSLFKSPEIPSITVNQFGITMYGFLDIKSNTIPQSLEENNTKLEKPEQIVTDYTRYIDDTVWESILEEETNSNYQTLHTYYLNKSITPKNEYTGIFEDKNLIVIMMESVNTMVINEEYYPNLYKLYSEGWAWDNAYSPRNACSTGNNEITGMMGLYTINTSCTANENKNNEYFQAIFNLFDRDGYDTSSYHNYADVYYDRKTIHPNMGSDIYYNTTNLGIPYNPIYQEWPSDIDLMNKSSEIFLEQDRYMAWITTVTPHQPYYVASEFGDEHLDLFEDTGYSLSLKRYLSKLKEFDLSIGALMDNLEASGKLEDTVIVLYSDHYPYGLTNNQLNEYFDYDVSEYKEVDRTPFIIYNSELKPTKFDDYTSLINLTPTIANLFDLNYDPRIYAGVDLFSEDNQDRVVFADGSWQDDYGYYSAQSGKITYFGSDEYTNEEIIAINEKIYQEIKMSNLAIKTNYFEDLGIKLAQQQAPITDMYREEEN